MEKKFNMIKDLIIIFILFIVPLLLLYLEIIPRKFYLHTLGIIFILSILFVFIERTTLGDLGIRTDNFKETFLPHLIFTIISLSIILIFVKYSGATLVDKWWLNSHFQYFFIIISFVQVFLFLGYLIPKLNSVLPSVWLAILINAVLYTLAHFIYQDFSTMWLFLFLGGLGFATIYIFYPNLILAGASHAVLNFFIVLFGYFTKLK